MLKTHLEVNYNVKFPISNFNILKIEDLFKSKNSDLIVKNHRVNFYILIFITEDIGRHSINFNDFYYSKGTVIAIRKDQIHRFYINNNIKGYILLFKEEFLNSYLNESEVANTIQMFNELLTSPKTQLKEEDYFRFLTLIREIENEFLDISDKYSLKMIRSLLHVLITLIHRIKSKGMNG